MPENLFFVPHTRWDREWYKSYEVFRMNFVAMMESFLEYLDQGGEFPVFFLDGQVILLKDYLNIHPEKREFVAELIRKGILRIGPWLVQPDLFMSGGEVIVRNLFEGYREARKWGDYMNSLYIPESTGIISQLPQIMQGVSMEHLVFIRGLGDEPVATEYRLTGSDGSSVLATYLVGAYNNAGFLPENLDEAKERVREEVEKLSDQTAVSRILLNQGGDHQAPQTFLPKLLEALRESGRYGTVEAGAYDGFYERIKSSDLSMIPRLGGEYRGSRHYPILAGKISSRMDLKLQTVDLLNRILTIAEPLATMEWVMGREYPGAIFTRIWELMLENQHHTTAGGTVIDQVYREALVRLDKVRDLLDEEWKRAVGFMSGKGTRAAGDEGVPVVVVNTLPVKRAGLVQLTYTTTRGGYDRIRILDEEGKDVPFQVLNFSEREGRYPFYSRSAIRHWELAVETNEIPAAGHRVYTIKAESGEAEPVISDVSNTIRNEFLEVGFEQDGTFFIRELHSGREYRNLHRFTDEADAGDLYNYSPIPGDIALSQIVQDVSMEIVSSGELEQTLRLRGNLSVPASLSPERNRRSPERVLSPFTLNLTLHKGLPYVDCHLTLLNKAKDHKLKVVFPTTSNAGNVLAGQPFDLVERPIRPVTGEGWIETPSPSQPFQGFLDLPGDDGSMAVFSLGPLEYEIAPTSSGNEIHLTLIRSVGWMSREGLLTRKVEAGPKVPTPEGQVLGNLSYRYALVPHNNEDDLPGLMALYQQYKTPLLGVVLPGVGGFPEGESLISIEPSCLVMTAFKRSAEGNSVIVRLYNPTSEVIRASVRAAEIITGCRGVDMFERGKADFRTLPLELSVMPREIVTLEFRLKEQE